MKVKLRQSEEFLISSNKPWASNKWHPLINTALLVIHIEISTLLEKLLCSADSQTKMHMELVCKRQNNENIDIQIFSLYLVY